MQKSEFRMQKLEVANLRWEIEVSTSVICNLKSSIYNLQFIILHSDFILLHSDFLLLHFI